VFFEVCIFHTRDTSLHPPRPRGDGTYHVILTALWRYLPFLFNFKVFKRFYMCNICIWLQILFLKKININFFLKGLRVPSAVKELIKLQGYITGTRIPDPLFPHLIPPAIMVWIFVWKYIFEPFIHILQHFVLQLSRSTNFCF
jgi:hypothetical protein